MIIKANSETLRKHAKALLGNEWSEETQAQLIDEALNGFTRTRGHISHDRAEHLERLNTIMRAHGVEGILEGDIDIQYVNQGDTYDMTLLYWNDAVWVGDWGSIVEEMQDSEENS